VVNLTVSLMTVSEKEFVEALQSTLNQRNPAEGRYHSIYSGAKYRECLSKKNLGDLSQISINPFFDSIPINNYTSYQMLLFTVNELPGTLQWKRNNCFLGAISFSSISDPNIVLAPFVHQMKQIFNKPPCLKVNLNEVTRDMNVSCIVMAMLCDLKEKAPVMGLTTVAGYMGYMSPQS
jgi:hypothetical protein